MAAALLLLLLGVGLLKAASQMQCPSNCHCQLEDFPTSVNCTGQQLITFSMKEIDSSIQIVDLSHNNIHSVPAQLKKMKELQYMSLAHNQISQINAWSFKDLNELQTLDLSNNYIINLTAINARTFVLKAEKLRVLNLSGNAIQLLDSVNDNGIIHSITLQVLDLSGCKVEHIDNGTFLRNLTSLQHLNLSRNPIKWMSSLTSQTLRHLDLSRCMIDYMRPDALKGLTVLETLDVSRNRKFRFSARTEVMSESLQVLEARSCVLLLEDLNGFPNLTRANLHSNSIKIIPQGSLKNNMQLKELDLSSTNIRQIHKDALIMLSNLETLNLENNYITSLDFNVFSNNLQLTTVRMAGNPLTKLNISSGSIKNLDVSHCTIEELHSNSLKSMTSLLDLNLSDNKLENIPDNLQSLSLKELDLSSCRLSTIGNHTFQNLPQLTFINLAGNRFTMPFKAYWFDYNEHLNGILLSNNPWICDCNYEGFVEFTYYALKLQRNDISVVKCLSPLQMKGMKWQQACHDVWYQNPNEGNHMQRSSMILLGSVLGVGGLCLLVTAVRHAHRARQKKRVERRRLAEQNSEQATEIQSRLFHQHFESTEESPFTPPRTRPRIVSEPPTYEEALLMSRSQQDLLEQQNNQIHLNSSMGRSGNMPNSYSGEPSGSGVHSASVHSLHGGHGHQIRLKPPLYRGENTSDSDSDRASGSRGSPLQGSDPHNTKISPLKPGKYTDDIASDGSTEFRVHELDKQSQETHSDIVSSHKPRLGRSENISDSDSEQEQSVENGRNKALGNARSLQGQHNQHRHLKASINQRGNSSDSDSDRASGTRESPHLGSVYQNPHKFPLRYSRVNNDDVSDRVMGRRKISEQESIEPSEQRHSANSDDIHSETESHERRHS